MQSGHWAPFESLTNWLLTKWDNAGPRKKMTTKVLYWSVQHILKVNLSCPNKGFSSNQRGKKPQPQECSTHSWLSYLLTLNPAFETSPKLIDKICLFPVLLISWEWKVNSFLGNKFFLIPFQQEFLNGGNNCLASSDGHTGKQSHSLIFMYTRKKIFTSPFSFVLPEWCKRV